MGQLRLCIREVAEARGLNMSQLQRKTGLTSGMIRRYWYNRTSQVSLPALGIIAQLLEVRPGDLLTDAPDD